MPEPARRDYPTEVAALIRAALDEPAASTNIAGAVARAVTPLVVELATEVQRLRDLRNDPLRDPEMFTLIEASAVGAADAVLRTLDAHRTQARAEGFAAGLALAGGRPARGGPPGRQRIIVDSWPGSKDTPLDHLSDQDLTAWVEYHQNPHAPRPEWLSADTARDVNFPCAQATDFPPLRRRTYFNRAAAERQLRALQGCGISCHLQTTHPALRTSRVTP